MFLIKSLTLYFKFLLLCLFLLNGSCVRNIIYETPERHLVFVSDIQEKRGMLIRNTLLSYFPNKNYDQAKYILNVFVDLTSNYYLTTKGGYASRNRLTANVRWNITEKSSGKIILNINNTYIESYSVDFTGYSNNLALNNGERVLANSIANDVAIKAISTIKELNSKKSPSL